MTGFTLRRLIVLLVSAGLTACTGADEGRPSEAEPALQAAPSPAPEEEADGSPTLRAHMGEHFWMLADAQTGVILDDLNMTREASRWLAEHEPVPGLPSGAQGFLEPLRRFAREAAEARSLEVAAVSVARTASVCGDCHTANSVSLATALDEAPDVPSDTRGQMALHIWAADWMWEGLVAPSDRAWNEGARALTTARLRPADLASEDAIVAEATELIAHVQTLASNAIGAAKEERPGLYGELLATCGRCHSMLGGGPR